jgi:ELWxxDGT repeat protein
MVLDLVDKDNGGGRPGDLFALGGDLLFLADDGLHGRELWTSDGTAQGTRLVLDNDPDPTGFSAIAAHTEMGGIGFLSWYTNGRNGLWRADGTAAGTIRLTPEEMIGVGVPVKVSTSRLFFIGNEEEHGARLWTSDGTVAGTRMLGDLRPGPDSFVVAQLVPAGPRMFLNANEELWVSDGTAAGTRKVSVRFPNLDLEHAVSLNGRLFFPVFDASHSVDELWVSDGSESGTKRLLTTDGERLTSPKDLVAFEGRLWFLQGGKLWSTDGTTAGTVAQVSFDSESFVGEHLTPAGGRLFFSGWTPQTGHELWRSTRSRLRQILPRSGSYSSPPSCGGVVARADSSAMERRAPPRMTERTWRTFSMSAVGSAPRIRRSACFPFSTVPRSFSRPRARALPRVEATSTSIGVRPAACMASISA